MSLEGKSIMKRQFFYRKAVFVSTRNFVIVITAQMHHSFHNTGVNPDLLGEANDGGGGGRRPSGRR